MLKHGQGQPEQHELLGVSLKAAREAIVKSVPYQLLYFQHKEVIHRVVFTH
jgi:hypothetical protein